jgi:septal ring factor EnvC (AmiA/AmiB activator)
MTKDQIIDMLMAQLDALTRQLEESNRQNSVLTSQVAALTAEVAALRAALEGKEAEAERQKAVNRGLSALVGKGSEKQAPPPLTDEEREVLEKARAAARKSRGNNGARRDMHAGMEEDVVDVYPEDPAFNRFSAREVGMREAVRYVYERARVRKTVYRIHVYVSRGRGN